MNRGPALDGLRLADRVSKFIFLKENLCILIWISLKFICREPVDKPTSVVWADKTIWSNNGRRTCLITLGELTKRVFVVSHLSGRKFQSSSYGVICVKNWMTALYLWCRVVIWLLMLILQQMWDQGEALDEITILGSSHLPVHRHTYTSVS